MPSRPEGEREQIAGPDEPQSPFPLKLRGPVIKGFGRGSKELGIPTANIPISGLSIGGHDDLESGIYYGWCSLDMSTIAPSTPTDATPETASSNHAVADLESSRATTPLPSTLSPNQPSSSSSPTIYPTVLSIGYNPFYANTHRSIEIHIMHTFPRDFYGATLSLIILGFIRPEYDYVSKEALVEDIREDIRVAGRSLAREKYQIWRGDEWLIGSEGEDVRNGENDERDGNDGNAEVGNELSNPADRAAQTKRWSGGQKPRGPAKCEMMP